MYDIIPQAIIEACSDIIAKRLTAFALGGLITITKTRALPALRAQWSRLTRPTREVVSAVGLDNRRRQPSPRRGQGRRGPPRR